jgi:hypothetical protein
MHAEVARDAEGYVLHAHGATGTRVNGQPVGPECRLEEGDLIEIAFTTLRFTTEPPTGDMLVLPRDTPTFVDSQEGPTRATLRAVTRAAVFGSTSDGTGGAGPGDSPRLWWRLWRWLTRRAKTD